MEIILFTYGDAEQPSTWSNVPFCFHQALLNRGCVVHNVDILYRLRYSKLWHNLIEKPLDLFFPGHQYAYLRSNIFHFFTYIKIRKAVKKYASADWCYFLNFDFYNKFSDIPSLVFGDWTFQIYLEHHLGREPYFFEKWYIDKQRKVIENSERVVCLFQSTAESINKLYSGVNALYLGQNVINNLYQGVFEENDIIARKQTSSSILFVGGYHYLNGAVLLKSAIDIVRRSHPDVILHLVGLYKEQLQLSDSELEYVHCHGYLDKANEKSRQEYYNLMLGAKLFCNPSPVWAGYSSTVEAMYFYTPVVSSGFRDFVKEFGDEIRFGKYDNNLSAESLAKTIIDVIDNSDYKSMATYAHFAVKDYSWEKYVQKVIGISSNQ